MAEPPIHIDGKAALLPYKTIGTFPVGSFLENLAVRSNGTLLISDMLAGEIWYLDPNAADPQSTIRKVHTFVAAANADGAKEEVSVYGSGAMAMAIVEDPQKDDVFYALSGTHSVPGTWNVTEIDLRNFDAENAKKTAAVKTLCQVPEAKWLNGATMIPQISTLVMADSLNSKLYACDIRTGETSIWLEGDLLGKMTGRLAWPGVNGVQFFRNALFMTNSDRALFLRVSVDPLTSKYVPDSLKVVAKNCGGDDFTFDKDGNAYFTTHPRNTVLKLVGVGMDQSGREVERLRVMGGSGLAKTAGPTAAAFGRTAVDRGSLYVTTDGGFVAPVGDGPGLARVIQVEVGIEGESRLI